MSLKYICYGSITLRLTETSGPKQLGNNLIGVSARYVHCIRYYLNKAILRSVLGYDSAAVVVVGISDIFGSKAFESKVEIESLEIPNR